MNYTEEMLIEELARDLKTQGILGDQAIVDEVHDAYDHVPRALIEAFLRRRGLIP